VDITVVSGRAEALEQALCGALAGRVPADARLRFFASDREVDRAGRLAEIALGAPDLLAPLIEDMPRLQWVQSTWAGITPFLDVPRRDYLLTGVKDIFGQSMSEYVLGWLLALQRGIIRRAVTPCWDDRQDPGLSRLSVGIAGVGSIGSAVAQTLSPFVAEIRGLNSDGRDVAGCGQCFASEDKLAFAEGLQVLLMILPDTDKTDGLIDEAVLARLQPGAILINSGRANALELPAALRALESSQLGAMVLDVLDQEPLADDDPLWQVPGLYISSHTSAPTDMERIAGVFLDNLECYRAGRPLQGVIDFGRGY
jgi:phosphoglycerate dehydrogenase-like enzyme